MLAEEYYGISLYTSCESNPIQYIDEKGLASKMRLYNRVVTHINKPYAPTKYDDKMVPYDEL